MAFGMHRLLVSTDVLNCGSATLPTDAVHHLKVVRPKSGELIELFDGAGRSRLFRCGDSAARPLVAAGELSQFPPLPFRLSLFACVTKGSRWDWTVEKATELGVSRIVPVLSERCIVRIAAAERNAKRDRWRRIAEDAARQSDAKWLPDVLGPVDFAAALGMVKECACFVGALAWPTPEPLLTAVQKHLRELPSERALGLFVGPEGDFTPDELSALLEVATPTSFGPTVLRAETAAIFGVSTIAAALHGFKAG